MKTQKENLIKRAEQREEKEQKSGIGALGKKRMAFYLLEGISKSITYSISRSNEELKKMLNEVIMYL